MGRKTPDKAKHPTDPSTDMALDSHALGHERWVLLWRGALALLEKEEPQAFSRLMTSLAGHGLD